MRRLGFSGGVMSWRKGKARPSAGFLLLSHSLAAHLNQLNILFQQIIHEYREIDTFGVGQRGQSILYAGFGVSVTRALLMTATTISA